MLSPINHPAASGRNPTTAWAATGAARRVSPAYASAAPSTAAATSTARTDSHRGRPAATTYPARPSIRLASSDVPPDTTCATAASTASPRTGSGHRLPNTATGTHARTARSSLAPRACGWVASSVIITTRQRSGVSAPRPGRRRSAEAGQADRRGDPAAEECVTTLPTVATKPFHRISPEDDGRGCLALVGEGGGGPQPAAPGQRGGDEVRHVGPGDLPAAGRRVIRADPVLPGAGAVDEPGRAHQGPVEAGLPHHVLHPAHVGERLGEHSRQDLLDQPAHVRIPGDERASGRHADQAPGPGLPHRADDVRR